MLLKRPTKLDDLKGVMLKDYVKNCVKENSFPKAILLKGHYGTGKTTAAYIIAATINCLNLTEDYNPCGECPSCKSIFNETFDRDVLMIDGGQVGKQETIAQVTEFISFPPLKDKKKVLIMEEVQELSPAAKNSFLKILEAKDNVHYIFTSMENLLPSGFYSRMVPFNFRKATFKEIALFLNETLKKLNLADDPSIPTEFKFEGLCTIAQLSNGSYRQALQLLDTCLKGKFYTVKQIQEDLAGFQHEMVLLDILYKLADENPNVLPILLGQDIMAFVNLGSKIIIDAVTLNINPNMRDDMTDKYREGLIKLLNHPNFNKLFELFDNLNKENKYTYKFKDIMFPILKTFFKKNIPIEGVKIREINSRK